MKRDHGFVRMGRPHSRSDEATRQIIFDVARADPEVAAGMLLGRIISETQRAVILRQRKPLTTREIAKRAKSCAGIFLEDCRARTQRSKQAVEERDGELLTVGWTRSADCRKPVAAAGSRFSNSDPEHCE